MPQWKKNMLERQKKEADERNTVQPYSTSGTTTSSSRYNSSNTTPTSTAGGKVEEEDYITRRRRERAEQEKLTTNAASFRSRSVQPESSSSGYESTPEMKSYER